MTDIKRNPEGPGRWRLESRQRLAAPLDEVFAFFSDPGNLKLLTPRRLEFEIVGDGPIEMKAGARIDYRVRILGLRMEWTTIIAAWNPPESFVDRQATGPYKVWLHTHRFEADGDDATVTSDEVQYSVPGGAVVHRLLVKHDLQGIFEYRARKMSIYFNPQDPLEKKLPRTTGRPNCISSFEGEGTRRLPPLPAGDAPDEAMTRLKEIIEGTPGGEVVERRDDYLYAEFRTSRLRFVDDVEFVLDREREEIHFTSQSRTGYYDFGVNRQRMLGIAALYGG